MEFTYQIVEGGTNKVRLDISDVKFPKAEEKEMIEPYLLFNAGTYKNIKEVDVAPEAFMHIFRAPNYALSKLSNEQKVAVAEFFASANYTIKNKLPRDTNDPELGSKFLSFVEKLGEQYRDVVKKVNLIEHFRAYAASIQLQDTSNFGNRPQDTEELTFREPEMREVMVLAMFGKFASPIFGELINNLPEQREEDGKRKLPKYKESSCSGFMTALIGEYFADLVNHLQLYIHHIVNSICAKNQDPAVIFHGLTPNIRTSIILSSLLVRNYVLCELEKPESNIMRYTDTMVRTLTQTQDTNAHKSQVRTRKAPGSMMIGDESGNMAQMEIDSLVSTGTMDGPIIIESSIESIVQEQRLIHNISKREFDECLEYFNRNPIYPTSFNKFVASEIFSTAIGGGKGIEMLDHKPLEKLIALLQLMAFSLGYIELGNMLTASKSDRVRISLTANEDIFVRQAPTLPNYRDCRARFAAGESGEMYQDLKKSLREAQWDKHLEEIITDLAQTIYLVNTPDVILNMPCGDSGQTLGDIYHNGDEIAVSTKITEQMCMLFSIHHGDSNT